MRGSSRARAPTRAKRRPPPPLPLLLALHSAGAYPALAAALEEQATFLASAAPAAAAALEAAAAPLRAAASRALAARRACSHVACGASAGLTRAEGRALGLKTQKCSGCVVARYCSPACQHADWQSGGHKAACAALRAEAAAAALGEEVGALAL